MIQRNCWIVVLCVFSSAFASDISHDVDSNSQLDMLLTTVSMIETSENATSAEISATSQAESPSTVNAGSAFVTELTTNVEESENSSISYKSTMLNQPVFIPSTTKMQNTSNTDEMPITYQSSTQSTKKRLMDEVHAEISSLSNSYRNLYYDTRTTTEYGMSREMSAESPDIITNDDIAKSTPSMGLISEKTNNIHFNDSFLTTQDLENDNILSHKSEGTNAYEVSESILEEMFGNNSFTSLKNVLVDEKQPENESKLQPDSMRHGNNDYISNTDDLKTEAKSTTTDVNTEFTFTVPITDSLEKLRKDEEILLDLMSNEGRTEIPKEIYNISKNSSNFVENSTHLNMNITLKSNLSAYASDNNTDNISVDATETNFNSTRNPKRIQGGEERYPEGRIRPVHPDPGYANRPELDLVRPYRPDSPLHQYPYYRPTPDYRTPLIREDKDYTRPPRPDPEYPRVSFRPNYSYSKPSQSTNSSKSTSSSESVSPKPYRPSFNRPYQPQSSFGRPYRPDYLRPASKPSDYSVTQKPTTDIKSFSNQEHDVSEHSRADYDYTRLSDTLLGYTKHYQSDVRPSHMKPDVSKPHRPTFDSETSMHSKSTSSVDILYETRDSLKVSRPDIETNRPSSFYPRPGFGSHYQTSDTPAKPFSIGTVTSAKNLTRVEFIKADCFDNHMKVTMRFNGTFNGLVYSSGYAQDSSCSYVNGSGRNHYEFYIRLNRCGTLGQQEVAEQRLRSASRRRQERAQYLVNTVTVQYNPVIEEDIDEHFRVTCEYGYDFWKTVTFPIVSVESSAVKVRTGSPVVFTLPPPQCNMEIRSGFGPSGTRVSGPVNVGDPLTLVIHMKSESTGFDILVSNCFAHNGAQKRLQLIDSNGCVVQEKLVSPFRGVSSPDRSQQVTLYSYLKAFRFTGSPALYIECDVHMCHGSCPPQRCYWRHLYKRSAEEVSTQETTTADNVMSESISLFQALEVRHDETDSPNSLAIRNSNGSDVDDIICLRSGGFAAMLACLLLLLFLSMFAAICMCLRMQKMKRFVEAPDTKHFVEFDGHVPLK